MKNHSYIPRPAKVLDRYPLGDEVVGLRLKLTDHKAFHYKPGQFVMISLNGQGEVPLGIANAPKEKGVIEVAVRSEGGVTTRLCALSVGDAVGVNGPFGNGFDLARLKGKDVAIIAGGIGLPPLRSLIEHIGKNNSLVKSLTVLIGARSEENLLYRQDYKDWSRFAKVYQTLESCDPDWEGSTGNVTKLFELASLKRGAALITCGPPGMYPEVIRRYAGKSVADQDLYFLLERRMNCGVGKCQHCTCGELYVCLDGPVFSYDQIKYNPEAFK